MRGRQGSEGFGRRQTQPLATCTAHNEFLLDALSLSAHDGTDPCLHTSFTSLFARIQLFLPFFFFWSFLQLLLKTSAGV